MIFGLLHEDEQVVKTVEPGIGVFRRHSNGLSTPEFSPRSRM